MAGIYNNNNGAIPGNGADVFGDKLVGNQFVDGVSQFTLGNFEIKSNINQKDSREFSLGNFSEPISLESLNIATSEEAKILASNRLEVFIKYNRSKITNFTLYGSLRERLRVAVTNIIKTFPAEVVFHKIRTWVDYLSGETATNIDYNPNLKSTNLNLNVLNAYNPFNIEYSVNGNIYTDPNVSPLRNLTLEYGSYVIEHNGISKNIKGFTGSTQKTNSEVTLVVDGNPFPELTGIYIPQFSFLVDEIDGSIPYFIKPNESEIERFFTGLDDFQRTILNREVTPKYRAEIISSNYTDEGVLLTSKKVYDFPVLIDGYNLNFFDSFYLSYLDNITKLGENLDETKTDTLVRKYTTEAINSFDTLPTPDKDDLTLNGEKATKLIRIYGVEFDYIKKYINGIKFAHVVTYDKKNNIQDSLVKDLSHMLGLEPINFINDTTFSKLYLPSNGGGEFSGTSTNLSQSEIETELYRRLILNIAWIWKSKGTRKAIEFLFRYIGAPESLVNFNEYVVLVDKPLDI